jgi:predicted translin family RNA/ssDNA-binding protein
MTIGSQVKQTLASLKSIHAGLQALALASTDERAQREFHEAMLISEDIIADLKKRIGQLEWEEPQYNGM